MKPKNTYLKIWGITMVLGCICSCSSLNPNVEQKEYIKVVPDPVRQSFQLRHPKQTGVFFRILEASEATYEVEFSENGKKRSESFSENGKLVEEEVELNISEIPKNVSEMILKDIHARYETVHILSIQSVDAGMGQLYEFKIKTSKSKTGVMESYYDFNGKWKSETPFMTKPIDNLN